MRNRLLLVLALVSGLLPMAGGPVHASPIPQPPELWVMNADGTGQRPLYQPDFHRLTIDRPAWSPDGTEIAFAGGEVRIVPVAGGEPRVVANVGSFGRVSWSPDGQWLAFPGSTQEVRGLFLVRPDGSELHHIGPNLQILYPEWSPDGTKISFVSVTAPSEVPQLQVIDRAGTGLMVVATDASFGPTSWSPDGTRIAYIDDNQVLAIAALDGTVVRPETGIASAFAPAWSPDGTKIALGSGQGPLYAVNPDGSDKVTLATAGGAPDWDPTSQMIAFSTSLDIFSVRRDATALANLTNTDDRYDYSPAWSPDGTQIAYVSEPKPFVPPDEFYERDLSLNARNEALRGRLASSDQRCYSGQKVRIERRRADGWRRVAKLTTNDRGRFRFEPRRFAGRFRAVAPASEVFSVAGNRVHCGRAKSPVLRVR